MRFFNSLIKCLPLALLLTSCAGVVPQKKKAEKPEVAAETPAEGAEAVFARIPNPYQPGGVPGPARREHQKIKGLMQAKKWTQAKGLLELMAETYPKLSGPYVNLGIVHHQLGEFDAAEKALKFAIETNPQNFDAYTRLGLLYRELGRFDEAEATYLQALSLWPHHLPSSTNLGILYDLYMGRFEDALVYYQLSQQILGGEDRQLKGWIIDLQRRMASQ